MPEMTKPQPQPEHQWLQKLVGEWTWEHESPVEPGKSAEKHRGTESVRSLDGIWIIAEGRGEMPGLGLVHNMMTLGFDTTKKRFVGTFVASMMTDLWVYDGALDTAANALVLDTEGPSFADPTKRAKYKDSISFESDDHRIMTSAFEEADGKWMTFMTAHYRRTR